MEDLFDEVKPTTEVEVTETTGQVAETDKDAKKAERQARADFFKEKDRLENEAKAAKAELQRYKESLGALGYTGGADEIKVKIEAEKSGKSVDEVKETRERIKKEIEEEVREKTRREALLEIEAREQLKADLEAIKAKYPEVDTDDPRTLGEKFIKLMATGAVDAVEAYELTRPKEKQKAVSTGSTEGKPSVEKDYFTPSEVKKMSEAEISKNYEKIQKSMSKWR